jgi:hypothetical protein
MSDGLSSSERETTISSTDDDDLIRIYTCQRANLNKLRKHPRVSEISSGHYGTTEHATFTIAKSDWDPVRGIRHVRNMTFHQKRAVGERLAAARAARAAALTLASTGDELFDG